MKVSTLISFNKLRKRKNYIQNYCIIQQCIYYFFCMSMHNFCTDASVLAIIIVKCSLSW